MLQEIRCRLKLVVWLMLFAAPLGLAEVKRRIAADDRVRMIYPAPSPAFHQAMQDQPLADASR